MCQSTFPFFSVSLTECKDRTIRKQAREANTGRTAGNSYRNYIKKRNEKTKSEKKKKRVMVEERK